MSSIRSIISKHVPTYVDHETKILNNTIDDHYKSRKYELNTPVTLATIIDNDEQVVVVNIMVFTYDGETDEHTCITIDTMVFCDDKTTLRVKNFQTIYPTIDREPIDIV